MLNFMMVKTALYTATLREKEQLEKMLIKSGADINEKFNNISLDQIAKEAFDNKKIEELLKFVEKH